MNKIKILSVILALLLTATVLFTGCGEDKKDDEKKDETSAVAATTAVEKETEADKEKETEGATDKAEEEDVNANEDEEEFMGYDPAQITPALHNFCETGDIEALRELTLPKSAEIIEIMKMQDLAGNNVVEYYGYNDLSDIIAIKDEITDIDCYMDTDIPFHGTDAQTGEETDFENVIAYENNHFETNAVYGDLYNLTKSIVNDAYADSAEKVEYVSLSSASMTVYYGESESITHQFFAVETNVGWFLLSELV